MSPSPGSAQKTCPNVAVARLSPEDLPKLNPRSDGGVEALAPLRHTEDLRQALAR